MGTFRFVTNLVAGGRVRLFYQTTGIVAGNTAQQHLLPSIAMTLEEFITIQKERPGVPLRNRSFILNNNKLEWQ